MFNALAASLKWLALPTTNIHRLGRGLPGYLILFAPHAFASQRPVLFPEGSPSAFGIPSKSLTGFYPYTTKFQSFLSQTLGIQVLEAVPRVEP